MMNAKIAALGICFLASVALSQSAKAEVVYTSQAAFDAAAVTTAQTFGFLDATVGMGNGASDNQPIDSATSDQYVHPGDIIPGLSFSTSTSTGLDLALLGMLHAGNSNAAIFANDVGDVQAAASLDMIMSPGVTAFSMNVLSEYSSSDASINVYDTSSVLLGSFILSGAPSAGAGKFWGITEDTAIGEVTVSTAGGPFPGIDKAQIGSVVSATPEPGTMAMLALGLIGLGGFARRHRRQQ